MAAALCAHQQLCKGSTNGGSGLGWQPLRFAILCSGYASLAPEHQQLHAAAGDLALPSLHIFGSKSEDGGISAVESRAMVDYFDPGCRLTVEHSGGHYIPVSKAVLTRFSCFLRRFQK